MVNKQNSSYNGNKIGKQEDSMPHHALINKENKAESTI